MKLAAYERVTGCLLQLNVVVVIVILLVVSSRSDTGDSI